MEAFQERVVKEREDLNEKIIKLTSFIFSAKFIFVDKEEQERLSQQLCVMMHYSSILQDRIEAFKPTN